MRFSPIIAKGRAGIDMPDRRASRRPHASFQRESRLEKAAKIERLLSRWRHLRGARILDIGTGSGHIAATLAEAVGPTGHVWGVDLVDQRQEREGFDFVRTTGTALPFEDRFFDIAISNHVLEHVGGSSEQIHHLSEVRRVLKVDGLVYVAVPNRWRIFEPHFRLPFLSWFPQPLRDLYVQLAGRGEWYDVQPLSLPAARSGFRAAQLGWRECTWEAMQVMAQVETVGPITRRVLEAPPSLLLPLMPMVPTLIFLAWRKD